MTPKQRRSQTKPQAYARTFETFEEYERWLDENSDEPTPRDESPEERFWQLADLSDAAATLSPYTREYFGGSFESFEAYEAWRNGQTNPWNR